LNSALILIGSGCLVCLLPLGLYFLFLAHLNSRKHPSLLHGTWDLACLLMGLSGFIVVGGPVILAAFDSSLRSYLVEGTGPNSLPVPRSDVTMWSLLAAAYICGLVVALVVMFRARSRVSVLYNAQPADADNVLAGALERLHLPWRKRLGSFEIGSPDDKRAQAPVGVEHLGEANALESRPVAPLVEVMSVQIESFPAMRNVTLRWSEEEPELRRSIEAEIEKALPQVAVPDNPAASWLLTASVVLFALMLLWMALLIFIMVQTPVAPS
jgi:hypothetical protein